MDALTMLYIDKSEMKKRLEVAEKCALEDIEAYEMMLLEIQDRIDEMEYNRNGENLR